MFIPIIGLVLGIVIGFLSPLAFPSWTSAYIAVAILACADSLLGGISAMLREKFNLPIFISGFFGNAVIAMAIVWLGVQLNIELSIAAIVVFGSRLFQNSAFLRRFLLNKREKEDNI